MTLRFGFAFVAALLFTGPACRAPDQDSACAEIHFKFSSVETLHIGVLGNRGVFDTPCFGLRNRRTGERIDVGTDPVTTNWDAPAADLGMPVRESLFAHIPPGEYVMYIPASWVDATSRAEIGFGTATMNSSVGVNPRAFTGTPPTTEIPDGSL